MERYKVVFGIWDNQEGKQIFTTDGNDAHARLHLLSLQAKDTRDNQGLARLKREVTWASKIERDGLMVAVTGVDAYAFSTEKAAYNAEGELVRLHQEKSRANYKAGLDYFRGKVKATSEVWVYTRNLGGPNHTVGLTSGSSWAVESEALARDLKGDVQQMIDALKPRSRFYAHLSEGTKHWYHVRDRREGGYDYAVVMADMSKEKAEEIAALLNREDPESDEW